MATETLTVGITNGQKDVDGRDYISGDKDDNQIVTITDDGFTGGDIMFEFWGKGSPTEAGAGPGGDDVFMIDLSGFEEDFNISVKSMDEGDIFKITGWQTHTVDANGVHTFTYIGEDGNTYTMTIDPVSENGTGTAQVNCFTRGTRIRTRRGEVVVEALAVGDALLCTDGLYRPLRWIGRRLLSARELRAAPHLRPVELAQDALGPGKPEAPLALSPQHRVLLTGWRCELYFAEAEVLAPVKALVNDSTITRVTEERAVEYFHLLLDEHQVIYANGLECETLMPAELMREAMPPEGRAEICEIFPELAADFGHYGPLRHRALRSHEARVLLG